MSARLQFAHALRRSFDRSAHILSRAVYTTLPQASPQRHGTSILRDVPYRNTNKRAHLLDIYRPNTLEKRPIVLYVHGGAFCMLSKDTHRVMALSFASRGYVVFNINYRLGPRHLYPAPLEDAAAALNWVLDNAEYHGGDPTRIVLAGESAGANLVTALTYICTHRRPEAFAQSIFERNPRIVATLPIYGLLDMHNFERFTAHPKIPGWAKRELVAAGSSYVGHPIAEKAPLAALASPLRLLADENDPQDRSLPPFFIAVGTKDPLIDDSRRLKAVLDRRGTECELAIYPGEIHGFNAMVWRPAAQSKWQAVFNFLKRHAGQ